MLFIPIYNWPNGIVGRLFTSSSVDWGSIPGWIIPKTQKMVLDTSLLNTQHYKIWIKNKWRNPEKGVAPSPTPWYSNYWKANLWVALNYGRPTYLLFIPKSKTFDINRPHLNTCRFTLVLVSNPLNQLRGEALWSSG